MGHPTGEASVPTIEVVIDIPRGSRNKYEFDAERRIMRLTRRVTCDVGFPTDYGFIPGTLGDDGDPLDALVLVEEPTVPGCYVEVRPVGMLHLRDEHGVDHKIVTVPAADPAWEGVVELDQVPEELLAEITTFFRTYKDEDPDRWSDVGDFAGADRAYEEIDKARANARGRETPTLRAALA